jgi:hypothetical protein
MCERGVRQRHPHKHRWLAQKHPSQPSARSGHWMDMPLYNDTVGANNQPSPQRPLSHSLPGRALRHAMSRKGRRRPEPLLAASRVLSRHKPERHARGVLAARRCKIAPSAEVSGGARATRAVAINGPIPGIVISLHATSFSLARRLISALSLAIWPSRRVFVSIRTSNVARASSGKQLAGSSMRTIRRAAFAAPTHHRQRVA